jgi:hypothetical protein
MMIYKIRLISLLHLLLIHRSNYLTIFCLYITLIEHSRHLIRSKTIQLLYPDFSQPVKNISGTRALLDNMHWPPLKWGWQESQIKWRCRKYHQIPRSKKRYLRYQKHPSNLSETLFADLSYRQHIQFLCCIWINLHWDLYAVKFLSDCKNNFKNGGRYLREYCPGCSTRHRQLQYHLWTELRTKTPLRE